MKQKAFLIIFKGPSTAKISLRPESAPLKKLYVKEKQVVSSFIKIYFDNPQLDIL